MDGTTPNLNLVKPGRNGTADIEVLDQNMEKIDAWAGEKETELSGKEPTINKNSGFNKEKTDSVTTNSSVILATAKAIKTVWDALTNHRNSTSNPHTVTKSQVGLGNVPNYTITDSTTDGSSLKFGSAKAVKTVWDKALEMLGLANTNKNAIQNNTEQIENLSDFSNNIEVHYDNSSTSYNIKMTGHPKIGYVYFAHNNIGRSAELIWTGKKTQQRVYAAYNESDYYEVRSDGTFKSGSGQGGFTYVFSYKKITK